MTVDEIPQELLDILDKNAGKKHSRKGSVVRTLAEILTRYEQLLGSDEQWVEKYTKKITDVVVDEILKLTRK